MIVAMNSNLQNQFSEQSFIKSSRCVYPPGGCVEVAMRDDVAAVRDSKAPAQGVLKFTTAEWKAFVEGVKAGEFDPK